MKTIDRQKSNNLSSTNNDESTDSLSAELDLLTPSSSMLIREKQERSPQRKKSLERHLLLIVLPWILIPLTIGGFLSIGKIQKLSHQEITPQIVFQEISQDYVATLLLLFCLGGINSGVVLWLLTRRLSKSLNEMNHGMRAAALGNLETHLNLDSTPELQEVAEDFNQLVTNFNYTLKQQQLAAESNRLFAKIALAARESLDPIEAYNLGVTGVKQTLNVDRVFIYRFESDWSGVAIAEAVNHNWKSALFERVTDTYFTESTIGVEHYRLGGKLVIDDIEAENLTPCHRNIYIDMQVRANMVVPIVVHDKLMGLLCVQECKNSRHWETWEVDFCVQAAQKLGLAVEQIEKWERQSQAMRRSQMLSQTLQLQNSAEFAETVDEVLQSIYQQFKLDRASILSIDAQWQGKIIGEVLTSENISSILGKEINNPIDIEAFSNGNYTQGQVTAIGDMYQAHLQQHQIELMADLPARSRLLAPILVGGELFGLLIGDMCQAPREWTGAEIEGFAVVAQNTGLALDRSKILERREANLQRAKLLADITLQLRQSVHENEIFDRALLNIRQAFGLDRAIVLAFDDNWQGQIIAESIALPELTILGEVIQESWLESTQGGGYDRGRTSAIGNISQADLSECHRQLMERLRVRANIVAPILVGNKLFGLSIGHMCHQSRIWQSTEIDLFGEIATKMGISLHQAQLLAQREADARRSSILSNFTLQLRQSLDRATILNTAVELVRASLDLDRALILSLDADARGQIIAESVATEGLAIVGKEIHAPWMHDLELPYSLADVEAADLTDSHLQLLQHLQVRAILSAPITIDGQLFGFLIGHRCDRPRQWQSAEIDLLNQLATQLALAIHQSQLVEQLAIASQQQAKLAAQQQAAREALQQNAWDLLIQVDRISQGDLTIRARITDDEIGTIADSYNNTVQSLRKLVAEVQNVSWQVVNTTYQNSQSVAELSTEAIQQAKEVNIAHQRLEEMSQSIRMVVQQALAAESAVMEAAQIVQAGDAAMNRTVEGMVTIRHTVADTTKKVKRLGESSQKISRVVNLIGSFAAQTNLLALNASIEAARAGEEGRGFAIVAEEVRALARQSAAATGEIEQLVASIQMETNEVVTAMEEGTEQVVAGTKLVDETRSRLNQITHTSNRIAELVQAIAEAALVQSEYSIEVTQNIDRVSQIATKTSHRADRVQSSFQELLELSQELQTHVCQFKIE
jgi:methyl-accepting chemotaxis protein PixJ